MSDYEPATKPMGGRYDLVAWSRLVPKSKRVSYTFVIDDYLKVVESLDVGAELNSPTFELRLEEDKVAKFSLQAYPNGHFEDNAKFACFLNNDSLFDVSVKYWLTVKTGDGSEWWSGHNTKFQKIAKGTGWGYPTAFKKDVLLKSKKLAPPNDSLAIHVDFEVYLGTKEISGTALDLDGKTMPTFGNGMAKMLGGPFTDVQITCGGEEFKCHKAVLAARSSVFKAMFACESIEAREGKVIVADVDSATMKAFIKYLYTDEVHNDILEQLADRLLAVADKYDVPKLTYECERHMCSHLTIKNAAKYVVVAFLHEAKALKRAAFEMIVKAKDQVKATDDWSEVEQYSDLMKELLEAFMEKKN